MRLVEHEPQAGKGDHPLAETRDQVARHVVAGQLLLEGVAGPR